MITPLEQVWEDEGDRLFAYRDCSANHHPITRLGGRHGAHLNDGDIWEMFVDIPDNPWARPGAFTFDRGIDLLDYCWETTCAIVSAVERSLPPLYEWAARHQQPSKWSWLLEA